MLVFWKEKLVFLSVPKTGTTAYAAALSDRAAIAVSRPPGLKHMPLRKFDRLFRPMLEGAGLAQFDTLAVIREPIDWLGSWYRYRARPFLDGKPNSTAGVSFDAFCEAYMSDTPPAFARVGSQARFVAPREGGAPVTHLLRYEDQDRLRAFLSARIGPISEPPRKNRSPQMELDLSERTEVRLRAVCAADFALWNSLN